MTPISDIITALQTRVAAVTTYSQLPYVIDVDKNSFKLSQQGYAVRPALASETLSVTKNLTYLQTFEVVLTKGYIQSSVDDSSLQSAIKTNSDLMHSVFVDLEKTRGGLPATILNILDFIIVEPEIIEESKVVVITGQFSILYRLSTI